MLWRRQSARLENQIRTVEAAEAEVRRLLDELPEAVLLVEWPEHGPGELPPADLEITLGYDGEGRSCRLEPRSPPGQAMLAGLA